MNLTYSDGKITDGGCSHPLFGLESGPEISLGWWPTSSSVAPGPPKTSATLRTTQTCPRQWIKLKPFTVQSQWSSRHFRFSDDDMICTTAQLFKFHVISFWHIFSMMLLTSRFTALLAIISLILFSINRRPLNTLWGLLIVLTSCLGRYFLINSYGLTGSARQIEVYFIVRSRSPTATF